MLLDRFYDLTSGSLSLEEKDIKSLNLPLVRSHLGIVSQVRHYVSGQALCLRLGIVFKVIHRDSG
jgi:ABC-type multidrug transport system fused ATPase/permease subunit